MENLGPTITLGDPRDVLAPYGFAREYVKESAWRDLIERRMDAAGWIVILVNRHTPSLTYEICEALHRAAGKRILFVPPPAQARTAAWRREYDQLQESIKDLPNIHASTAAVLVYRGDHSDIQMRGDHSAEDQLASIRDLLIPKHLD